MTDIAPPKRHDTKNPLTCCDRCHRAELLGRAMCRPALRFDRLNGTDTPPTYAMYHGDESVATLRRVGGAARPAYELQMRTEGATAELHATSLRDARAVAEEAYTAQWLKGTPALRGPVRQL